MAAVIPDGYVRLTVALRRRRTGPGAGASRQLWHKWLHAGRVAGALWDGAYWWVPAGRVVVLPSTVRRGRPPLTKPAAR